jgi:hypothetical protein
MQRSITQDNIETLGQENFLKTVADEILRKSNKAQRLNALDLARGARKHYPGRHKLGKFKKGKVSKK